MDGVTSAPDQGPWAGTNPPPLPDSISLSAIIHVCVGLEGSKQNNTLTPVLTFWFKLVNHRLS